MTDDKILEAARSRMKLAMDALGESRESEIDDLKFLAGSPDNMFQWPQDVQNARGAAQGSMINARPCLTINKLPQHVLQVTNDQRQNRPSGKVIPVDDKADVKVAEIYDGIVRHIEYISDADVAYDTACSNQVAFGEGYFRVLTDYCDDMSFDQDIKIGRIRNSFSVYMDPTIQDPCGSDAQWCLISEDMLKEDFERQYPKATPISTWQISGRGDEGMSVWCTDKTIRVAEYFYYVDEDATICLYEGMPEGVVKGSAKAVIAVASGARLIRERQTTIRRVKWCKLNGYEVLESQDWAGKHIPVIRVVGNEFEIEGRLYVSGLVRNAKDAQRMYNYWVSQEAEMLALAPKAPFIGYSGQFEGYENQWKTANTSNWPYLEVNSEATDHDGRVFPLPQRAQPPMLSAGILQAKMGSADDIKGTTGQYDPSLGDKSNETSGRAIIARERQSDTGTYHYVDNLARAIRYGTRQIVDLIPKIYDTRRIARIIGMDGETNQAQIDPNQEEPVREIQQEDGSIKRIYNPGIGKYDVAVTVGPSYMTKRQEAMEAMAQLLQGNPQLWAVAGDLFIKNMDWPGAQEMAKRFAKTIPSELMDGDDESPELAQAKTVIQQQQQQIEAVTQMVQQIQSSIEAQQAETDRMKVEAQVRNDERKTEIQAFDAETKRLAALMDDEARKQELSILVTKTIHEILEAPMEQGVQ